MGQQVDRECRDVRQEITVTGTRINRAGFDQPTPTTVIGDVELRQGARSNIQAVLNDLPQVRPSVTPATTNGNTGTGLAPIDLRGLGTLRTLTLLNGRRFVGENNLNFVPFNLVDRVEIVTGGASAAYGAGAVAGVVNIILKRDLEGLTLGGQSGISSRGDGFRYGFDGAFGTSFAGGNGRVMVGAEYVDDKGIPDRNSRRNLGSSGIVRVTPGSTTDFRTERVRDVNLSIIGVPQSPDGLILGGVLAGQVFNPDGTLRRASLPDARGVGGTDSFGILDDLAVTGPVERLNTYARVSYDLGGATLWADGTYVYTRTNGPFLPDIFIFPFQISANNAFLRPEIRNQLAAAGQTSFTFSRIFSDIYFLQFDTKRTNYEGAVGINGAFGNGWKYSAHYSHGEIKTDERLENSRLVGNFNNAINAVRNSAGQIVCAINADASTTNDDPACAPLNPFGAFNASPAAIAYTRATQGQRFTNKLDSGAAEVQGDLFSLWAGPITAVVGVEARREEREQGPAAANAGAFGNLSLYRFPLEGDFTVKEAFGELAVPVLDFENTAKLDLNGAARYSDYSTSGGIWTWKAGGTLRLFDDLLLRATRSRDIRSPSIGELFNTRTVNVGQVTDRDTAGRQGVIPGFNASPSPTIFTGGNPDLVPETAKTLTFGGSFSPSFIPGLNLSVDYYDIEISGAIASLGASNLTFACSQGSVAACNAVIRDPVTQTITTVFQNLQNLASFEQRGYDFEASY
ncbi:MAG: TonB-dependent receptor, partial [Novosphingobium sp.]|nr:TonB-dependent receptor [Novosphingobium sp.]